MEKLKINTVSLPERCEVCHQADCFDPSSNYCLRCSGLFEISNVEPNTTLEGKDSVNIPTFIRVIGAIFLLIFAAIVGAVSGMDVGARWELTGLFLGALLGVVGGVITMTALYLIMEWS